MHLGSERDEGDALPRRALHFLAFCATFTCMLLVTPCDHPRAHRRPFWTTVPKDLCWNKAPRELGRWVGSEGTPRRTPLQALATSRGTWLPIFSMITLQLTAMGPLKLWGHFSLNATWLGAALSPLQAPRAAQVPSITLDPSLSQLPSSWQHYLSRCRR